MSNRETEELRVDQLVREREERDRAEKAPPDEAEEHDRRADKASYLREKLEQRAQAEREAGSS